MPAEAFEDIAQRTEEIKNAPGDIQERDASALVRAGIFSGSREPARDELAMANGAGPTQ